LFPKDFKKEVQVVATCLSWDGENDSDILGMIGASFALAISEIPWAGPLASVRINRVNGNWVINPTYSQRAQGDMDLTFSAIERDGKVLVNMIEMGSKEVSEKDFLDAFDVAEKELKKLIDFQREAVKKIGKEKTSFNPSVGIEIEGQIKEWLGDKLEKTIDNLPAGEKNLGAIEVLQQELVKFLEEKGTEGNIQGQGQDYFEKEIED
jgi:polyribonucleotide nucleotidyltransferase